MQKTNVMRLLELAKINYTVEEYEVDEADLSGVHTAMLLNRPAEQLFKTLVLKGEKYGYFVCCIPSCEEIDLKKAAKMTKEKKVDLIPVKDLLPLTGYIRGGCSPIGMKKQFPTYIDETASLLEEISVSAGIRGALVFLKPFDLISYLNAKECDLTRYP